MASVAFVGLYRNILQSRGQRMPVIFFFKWRTACCVLSQRTEGSLNRPSVTIHPCVPQRRLSLSVPSVQPQGESGGWGPTWSAVTSSVWLFRVPFFSGVARLEWPGSHRRPLLRFLSEELHLFWQGLGKNVFLSNNLLFYWFKMVIFLLNKPFFVTHRLVSPPA